MSDSPKKPRLLIFIVAYNAEKTIRGVLTRVPPGELAAYDTEVLIIDDASRDRTFEHGLAAGREGILPFKVTTLFNPVNQGYGGNQKIGYQYAIKEGFDVVALVHGDGQYAPEMLPTLVKPIADGTADAVFGSRMMTWFGALKGGMPLYKYVGNRILTFCQNILLRGSLSEFHSGYRIYSTKALARLPFHLNSNDFHFDTEIIIQLLRGRMRIREIPIPTYYGDEISHVNGMRYAKDVMKASLQARLMEYGVFYCRKFDIGLALDGGGDFAAKVPDASAQRLALERVPNGARVLDLGRSPGHFIEALKGKGCTVTGVGPEKHDGLGAYDRFLHRDIGTGLPDLDFADFDFVLALDVIEHMEAPEAFMDQLRSAAGRAPDTVFLFSAGNVAFAVTRLMLLIGQFNYGKRGILDLTHRRLFTRNALVRLLKEGGFVIAREAGLPPPFALALGENQFSRTAERLAARLASLWARMFAFQFLIEAKAQPTLDWLIDHALSSSAARVEALDRGRTDSAS